MKYLKKYNDLIKEGVSNSNTLDGIIAKMFRLFKTKDILSEIWSDKSLEIATDVYDSFIDLKELTELSEQDLQSFADNLGVGGEEDVVIAIYEKMYEEKFKRNIKDDIQLSIDTLQEFIENSTGTVEIIKSASIYLTELKKMQDIL